MDLPNLTTLIDLSGKRALVTGGSKGIGEAVATRLVEAGADVTIADLDPAGADVAVGMGAEFVVCDITDPDQLEAAVDAAAGAAGLDILVNNAGIYPTTGPVGKVTDEFVDRMLDVNVRAQFSAAREAAKQMTSGAIVNLASIAGLGGGAGISAYSASKAAVIALTKAFAHELGPRGIRVNAINPVAGETPLLKMFMGEDTPEVRAKFLSTIPLGRFSTPEDMGNAACYLCSDEASMVTGVCMEVDGGRCI